MHRKNSHGTSPRGSTRKVNIPEDEKLKKEIARKCWRVAKQVSFMVIGSLNNQKFD